MNKKIYIGILSLSMMVICACSNKDDAIKTAPLALTTNIETRAVTTVFSSGAQMNVFVKNVSSTTSSDFETNISASYNGTVWTVSPIVNFPDDGKTKAYIYASYPYSNLNKDASAIPVDVNSQTDYLYSGVAVSVSYSSPSATLVMKHAMSMLAFNITTQNYSGNGKITAIKFSGDGFYTAGTMNVESGVVKGVTTGSYILSVNNTINANGWTSGFPQAFCIPFSSTGKNVIATFTIDGKDYSMNIPEYAIALGMKYIFHLVLTENGLTALTNDTKVISLNNDADVVNANTYGTFIIKTTSTTVSIPQIGGNGLSGIVYWGDDTKDYYKYPLTHTYTTAGEHNIIVETWGGSSLTFNDLENTETIDVTSF